jgi:hypothetical protein
VWNEVVGMKLDELSEEELITMRAESLHIIYATNELCRSVIDMTMLLLSAARDNPTNMKILVELLGVTGDFFFSVTKSIDAKNN